MKKPFVIAMLMGLILVLAACGSSGSGASYGNSAGSAEPAASVAASASDGVSPAQPEVKQVVHFATTGGSSPSQDPASESGDDGYDYGY
ncbi:hypothetical protein [Cohnella sp. REN36]|uniref:hypothetical protein n=1 Tax=Cohnella sp. REN36 TaxID=2887347 RepID=UPI001D1372EE|nr:hypothetical protein [Cohnella sp. REN36]MCC3372266.1 hypothetical protein [Cohnella sp. REN36]